MDDSVRQLATDSGSLRAVRGQRMPAGAYVVVELDFASGTLRLSCDGNTDKVLAAVPDDATVDLDDVANDEPFVGLVGKVIEYAWEMENHRGYTDAFQLRFLDLETRVEATRQFEVGASVITVQRVDAPVPR
jgi:hypothetical protein